MTIEGQEDREDFEDTSVTDNLDGGAEDQGAPEGEAGQGSDTGEGNTDEQAAASSEADKDERQSLLDVVTTAAEKSAKAAAPSGSEGDKGTGKPDAASAETPDGTGEGDKGEQGKLPPFHEHPRWKELVQERDTLRGEAVQYRKITDFMVKHELQPGEMAEGMLIMGMIKTDPEKGLARMREHVSRLEELLGKSLPADLATQVEEGAVTEDVAKELAQARRRSEAATLEARRLTEERTQETQRNAAAQAQAALNSAVNAWESGVRGRDPDFSKKAEFVVSEVRAIMAAEGRPKTPEQAVDMSRRAYENVTKRLTGIMPKPPATRKTPQSSSRSPSATPTRQHKTLAEVVEAAANQPA